LRHRLRRIPAMLGIQRTGAAWRRHRVGSLEPRRRCRAFLGSDLGCRGQRGPHVRRDFSRTSEVLGQQLLRCARHRNHLGKRGAGGCRRALERRGRRCRRGLQGLRLDGSRRGEVLGPQLRGRARRWDDDRPEHAGGCDRNLQRSVAQRGGFSYLRGHRPRGSEVLGSE
jgi:hypothetical protein